MDSKEYDFLQSSMTKHTAGELMTYYERAAVGKHFLSTLPTKRYEILKKMSEEQFPAEEIKIMDFRKRNFESFTNDLSQQNPIIANEKLFFHHIVYEAIKVEV